MTDKNSSIKERHLSYNQLLLKVNGNVQQQVKDAKRNGDSRRNNKGTGSEHERADKTFGDRDRAKTRKRPRILLGR